MIIAASGEHGLPGLTRSCLQVSVDRLSGVLRDLELRSNRLARLDPLRANR